MNEEASNENRPHNPNTVASFPIDEPSNSSNDKLLSGANFPSIDDKMIFLNKLKEILICGVCLELKRCALYQCKHGHLICSGCFGDLTAESKLQNEITSCPVCNTTISKDLCSRNIAVENTICLLPVTCTYCRSECPLETYKSHKTLECLKRPTLCENFSIGCLWKGQFYEKSNHEEQCRQPELNGYNILKALDAVDEQRQKEINLYGDIMELISTEKFACIDVQFKPCGEENKNLLFETSKFSAFGLQWLVRGCLLKDETESLSSQLSYQLVSKSRLNIEMELNFILLRGPFIEMEIKPNLYQFKFSEKALESEYHPLTLLNQSDLAKFETAKRINLRIIMFFAKQESLL